MAENVEYKESRYSDYNYNDFTDRQYLDEIQSERFSNPNNYSRDDLILWKSFINDLKERKIKIKRNRGWFYDSDKKGDLNYTFDLYKKGEFSLGFIPKYEYEKKKMLLKRDIDFDKKILLEISKRFKNEKIYSFWENRNDNNVDYSLKQIKDYTFHPYWQAFSELVKDSKIDILKKPEEEGWFFTKKFTLAENIQYTFEEYYAETPFVSKEFRKESIITSFSKKYVKIIDIYKNFVMENDQQLNNLLNDLLIERNLPEEEAYEILVQEAKKKYNFQKDQYNENIEKYYDLSTDMKEKIKKEGKILDNFLEKLKPLVKKLGLQKKDGTILDDTKPEWQKKLDIENILSEKRVAEQKKNNEEIQELNEKIIDAQARYALKVGKMRVVEFKLEKLKKLEKRKSKLQQKLREKNLQIEERQQLLKEKTELNEKLKNIENVKDQLADLKSNIPSLSVFEQEKTLRENELQKLKNLNDASIREKNALLKSIEFEKIKEEIRIREQLRYQQEQRQKEELKRAKIVFLKEKKITERKLNELKISTKMKNDKITNLNKVEQDLSYQRKNLEKIKSKTQSELQKKKLQIETAKLKTLEIEKQTLEKKQDYAEQQKLFADSIQRDINDLNDEKNILRNLTLENEKILSNTKDEIRKRQEEIEKTIKLNLENLKQKEANILAEESKIKLDVFYTLEDVKEQTTKKLDLEKKLQDLKDEIIRKQDVSDLLNETIEKISNNEISEAEEYNAFLESEISFKKKLANTNLNQKQVLEILMEEKKSYLEFLKDTKSSYMQDLLNTKRDIIEKNIKISLIEGKENLSYVTFGMKFEIEKLEKEKEILQRRIDLVKFQSENYKKELNLRNVELELLKKIRIKVLENERKIARNEASSAISDMIKSIEKTERDSAVREKLDEMLDDVENKKISRKSKAVLFSLIDKIENKEIHEAAKEKLEFILGKIELHDNIDESKKALDKILDKIEDKNIRKDVEEKIDEILDDVELEDYDFLDEEDDFDFFLSNVKKHISGEKKMEQFSKIDSILEETRKVDTKLKMDENIEMKDFKRPEEEGEGSGETSFDDFDYTLFVNNIEDPILREKTRTFLGDIDSFDKQEDKIRISKNAYKSAINGAWWNDKLDTDYWDGNILGGDKADFLHEQKVNNLNTALAVDYDIHIDPTDKKIRDFLDIKVTNSLSEKRGEINGYIYNGEKIISRNISRNFYFNNIRKSAACAAFISDLKNVINQTAKSQIVNESYFEGKSVKDCALEYIGELREEQSYQIDAARNSTEMRNALRDVNDIDKEIKDIKKNLPFKMRMKIFRRTLSWRITKLLRLLWKHKGKTATIVFTLLAALAGFLLNQLGVVEITNNLNKAAKAVKQYANDVHEMGKRIIHNIQSVYRIPGQILGWVLIGLAFFLRLVYFVSRMSGTAGSAWVFGVFGTIIEVSLYFSGNVETINEKTSEILEETGNAIENAGIRSQKYIAKNMPRWYYDKPIEERNILQHIEAGAANVIFKLAKGTQYTGKKVQDAGEVMKTTIWYTQAFMIVAFSLMVLIFIRNYLL